MTRNSDWLVATHNTGKIKEIAARLAPHGVSVTSAAEAGLPEPDETGDSFAANAALKAEAAANVSGRPALADDSGLSVAALGGAPGIFSARWAGPEKEFFSAMKRVHDGILQAGGPADAAFVCVLALAEPGEKTRFWEGRVEGTIVWPPRGDGGFGYDPVFVPDGHDRTFAEMTLDEKQALSHRGRALDAMVKEVFGG